MTKLGVVVPTVNKLVDKVVVPMPTCGPLPVLTKKAGTMELLVVAVLVPTLKLPQTSKVYLGEVVAMATLFSEMSTNKSSLPTVRSPAMVEEAETMMPTVLVGLMALGPAYCQELGASVAKLCQVPKPEVSEVNTAFWMAPVVSLTAVVWMSQPKVEVALVP